MRRKVLFFASKPIYSINTLWPMHFPKRGTDNGSNPETLTNTTKWRVSQKEKCSKWRGREGEECR